jgi:uncharacterized protein YifN (PemK superfamily)
MIVIIMVIATILLVIITSSTAQPSRVMLQLESFARCSKADISCNDPCMGIKYPAGIGTILLCDDARGGFRPPEMVKRRPAIVISPRLPHRNGLCTVVPVSSDRPDHEVDYVVRLEFIRRCRSRFPIEWRGRSATCWIPWVLNGSISSTRRVIKPANEGIST